MNTLIKNVPIARVGKVFDDREITLHMLERCRDTFGLRDYQPCVGEIYIDWRESPTILHHGKVLSLSVDADTLLADIEMLMSPETVRGKTLYPGIAYLETKSATTPALIAVILGDKPNRDDSIAIKDCDICEAA
ncbi:hypothetical protein GTM63_002176 [Salmonella enterica]|nr:hypothetical protein [Salmonella enterica]